MKTFEVTRNHDESGISGTGHILSGVIFTASGKVVVSWESKSGVNSMGIYDSYYDFYHIHIASHPTNKTVITFNEKENPVRREKRQKCRHCNNLYSQHPKDVQWSTDKYRRSCSGNLVELKDA